MVNGPKDKTLVHLIHHKIKMDFKTTCVLSKLLPSSSECLYNSYRFNHTRIITYYCKYAWSIRCTLTWWKIYSRRRYAHSVNAVINVLVLPIIYRDRTVCNNIRPKTPLVHGHYCVSTNMVCAFVVLWVLRKHIFPKIFYHDVFIKSAKNYTRHIS